MYLENITKFVKIVKLSFVSAYVWLCLFMEVGACDGCDFSSTICLGQDWFPMDRCHHASAGFRRMDSPSRSTSRWMFPDQRSSLDMLGRRIQSMCEVIQSCPLVSSESL